MGIVIVLLFKCYFCIFVYFSVIILCSGIKIYNYIFVWMFYIFISLVLLMFVLILINYKGLCMLFVVSLVIIGCFLISYSELKIGEIVFYYGGILFFLFGVWVNGSFYYFFCKFIEKGIKIIYSSI